MERKGNADIRISKNSCENAKNTLQFAIGTCHTEKHCMACMRSFKHVLVASHKKKHCFYHAPDLLSGAFQDQDAAGKKCNATDAVSRLLERESLERGKGLPSRSTSFPHSFEKFFIRPSDPETEKVTR